MLNQYNPYSYPMSYQQTLPQQQIPTANGRASVDNIKLAPNSSVLVCDSTRPLIYKCVTDSLGNVSIETFDVTKHKDEEEVKKEQTELILADLMQRIERLEQFENINNKTKKPDESKGEKNSVSENRK